MSNRIRMVIMAVLFSIRPSAFSQGTYTNCVWGYSIHYDALQYGLSIGWDERTFSLTDASNERIDGWIVTINPKNPWYHSLGPNSTMTDSIFAEGIDDAKLTCASDGPDGSTSCKEIVNLIKYTTRNGLSALKFNMVVDDRHRGNRKEHITGPCYLIDISKGSVPKALLITFKFLKKASSSQEKKLDDVVQSVSIL